MSFTHTEIDVEELAKCLYILNRNVKAATNKAPIYDLKRRVIEKMIEKGLAEIKGLQFSLNNGINHTHSDVLVKAGTFYFHLPAKKSDYKELIHLGNRDPKKRNAKVHVPLKQAKATLIRWLEAN